MVRERKHRFETKGDIVDERRKECFFDYTNFEGGDRKVREWNEAWGQGWNSGFDA